MVDSIRTYGFKSLPIEIEVKDLRFIKELPVLMGNPHKATFYQIVYLTRGEALLRIDFRDVHLQAGDLLIISSGQVCQFDTASDYSGYMILFTAAFFNVTDLDAGFLHTAEVLNPVNLNRSAKVNPEFMTATLKLLSHELRQPADIFQSPIAQNFLRVILLHAERSLNASMLPLVTTPGRQFFNAVETHFRKSRNAEFYLSLIGVNEKVLAREVKASTGQTPKVYIDSRVILEAKRMLSYSDHSAKEIGFDLGFDEPTNFAKYFRKHTGMTPAEFRESTRK